MKKPKPYVCPCADYPDWVKLTAGVSPEVLKDAQRFAEENSLIMSQLVNSALKVFISEAEAYVKEQKRLHEKSGFLANVQKVPENPEPFRIYDVFSTADALKGFDEYDRLIARRSRKGKKK